MQTQPVTTACTIHLNPLLFLPCAITFALTLPYTTHTPTHTHTHASNTHLGLVLQEARPVLALLLLQGEARIAGQTLGKRDGFGIWDIDSITIEPLASGTEILLMEVPMNV